MKFTLSIIIVACCLLTACQSDDITIINNEIIEPQNQPTIPISGINIKTVVENDFFIVNDIEAIALGDHSAAYFSNNDSFYFNKEGYLLNNAGLAVVVFSVNEDASATSLSLATSKAIKLDYDIGVPKATSQVNINVNLPVDDSAMSIAALDSELNNGCPSHQSYQHATSIQVFDSIGDNHLLTLYMIKENDLNNTWQVRMTINCQAFVAMTTEILDFDEHGHLDVTDNDMDGSISTNGGVITYQHFPLNNGAEDLVLSIDFTAGDNSLTGSIDQILEVSWLAQNGFYSDYIEALNIDATGLVSLTLAQQEVLLLGKIALAKFPSPVNLEYISDSLWAESLASGEAKLGVADSENFGSFVPLVYDY